MSQLLISGFIVVRLPEMNRDPAGRGAFSATAPCLDTLCYGGIDRMPWFDIDEAIYAGSAPTHIIKARDAIEAQNTDFSGIDTCNDLELAMQLLAYSNRLSPNNELIVIRSEKLAEIKGVFEIDEGRIIWCGYDIVSLGNWSLLEAIFHKISSLAQWEGSLNEFGLFSASELCQNFISDYEAAAQKGEVEELPESPYGYDMIQIGKIRLKSE